MDIKRNYEYLLSDLKSIKGVGLKTSNLLNSSIIVSKQSSNDILEKIKNSIKENKSKKIILKNASS